MGPSERWKKVVIIAGYGMRAPDGAASSPCRTLHLAAVGRGIRLVLEQPLLARERVTPIGRGFIEQGKLLFQPAILIGALHQAAEWKGR